MANSIASSKGKSLVGVVGMAHLEGMESNLIKMNYRLIRGGSGKEGCV